VVDRAITAAIEADRFPVFDVGYMAPPSKSAAIDEEKKVNSNRFLMFGLPH
jgi:hypothetical protein